MSGGWSGREILSDLDVRPVINAHNDLTGLGGSLPRGPVLEAIVAANQAFIEVESLSDATGRAIADMLGIEAALVTPGAAAGAVLATAACITGGKDDLVARIPDTTGLACEFVVPADRRTFYDRSLEGAGGKIVLAGEAGSTSISDIERSITERTAGIFFYAPGAPDAVSFEQVLEIAKRHDLPLIVDAAEQVYPLENFSRYLRAGADFATYSGKFFGAGFYGGDSHRYGRGDLGGPNKQLPGLRGAQRHGVREAHENGAERDSGRLCGAETLAGNGPRRTLPPLPAALGQHADPP